MKRHTRDIDKRTHGNGAHGEGDQTKVTRGTTEGPLPRAGHRAMSLAVMVLVLSLWVAACGTTGSGASAFSANGVVGGQVQIVATENFWGSIAAQIGGDHVQVTSIINNPNIDPHSYEPTSRDSRAVADAHYVILNGVGYDPWASQLLAANPVSGRRVLNIGTYLGKHVGDNPHLWYSPDYVTAVANKIRDDLSALDPANATAYAQSTQTFLTTGLAQYHSLIAEIKAKYAGTAVGATESIFAYLAPALGLRLITPPDYLQAVSEGTEISAADEATVEQQINQKQIAILVYNSQNTPNNIQVALALARAQHIPIVPITETLDPANVSFQQWQSSQLQAIATALAQVRG